MAYIPTLGRFLQEDPAGYVDGPNRFQFEISNPVNRLDPEGTKTYVGIYYLYPQKDKNYAFRRAAQTWARDIQASPDFNPKTDQVILLPVTTKGDFKKAWNSIPGSCPNQKVKQVAVFTHASRGTNPGLNFHAGPTPGDDGTLSIAEIQALAQLNFDQTSDLLLEGCEAAASNSGSDPRSIAQQFADSQGVTTYGDTGKGSFSQSQAGYIRIDDTGTTVYLGQFNGDRPVAPVIANPTPKPPTTQPVPYPGTIPYKP